MLKMIKMLKSKSCSVCCIAMLTDKDFDAATSLCFEREPKDYSMDFDAMEAALKNAGLETACLKRIPKNLEENALIECGHKIKKYWHYIVYDARRQAFLDPIPSPPPINEYKFYRVISIK